MLLQDFGFGEIARGGWGNQGKRELGEPRGVTIWSLHIKGSSKNPSLLSGATVRKFGFSWGV